MTAHPADDVLYDVFDGAGTPEAREHVRGCAECAGRVEDAAAGLALAREAEMPEPSPLYWQSFRQQVGRRIEAAPAAAWQRLRLGHWLSAAAAILVAVVFLVPRPGAGPASPAPAAPVLEAWSALPAAEDDEGLDLLAAVMPADVELGPLAQCHGLGDCMSEALALSDEESAALAAALDSELEASS